MRRCTCRGQCGNEHPFRVVVPPAVARLLERRGLFDPELHIEYGAPDTQTTCGRRLLDDGQEWCGTCRSSWPRERRPPGMPMTPSWGCPNRQCEHSSMVHDIYAPDDPRPTCCVDGCPCGDQYRTPDQRIGKPA